jgi:hypothetical protein
MIGAGCGIGEHNLSQHSVKWCEKSGLALRCLTGRRQPLRRQCRQQMPAISDDALKDVSLWIGEIS